MIRTSLFDATGINGWNLSSPFYGNAISLPNPLSFAIDGLVEWEPQPGFAADRIQWTERQRTVVSFSPSLAREGWVLSTVSTSPHQVGIIERIATLVEVDALDEDGVPITTFRLDGQEIFDGVVQHPIPALGSLSLAWALRQEGLSYYQAIGAIDAVPFSAIGGEEMVPPWADDLFGWNARSWDQLQLVYPDGYRVRLWLIAQATVADAWTVRAKGRLGGYAQARSGRDAAGRSARVRS